MSEQRKQSNFWSIKISIVLTLKKYRKRIWTFKCFFKEEGNKENIINRKSSVGSMARELKGRVNGKVIACQFSEHCSPLDANERRPTKRPGSINYESNSNQTIRKIKKQKTLGIVYRSPFSPKLCFRFR